MTCHHASARRRCSCFSATTAASTERIPCYLAHATLLAVTASLSHWRLTADALQDRRRWQRRRSWSPPAQSTTECATCCLPRCHAATVAASLRPSALLIQHWMTTHPRRRLLNLTTLPASLPSLVEHPCPLSAPSCSCKRKMTARLRADAPTELPSTSATLRPKIEQNAPHGHCARSKGACKPLALAAKPAP
jgi:hypothetical protein